MKRNKKSKKLNIRKILFMIILIMAITYLYKLLDYPTKFINIYNNLTDNLPFNTSNYATIKKDINENYAGVGQEKVKNTDGYFTTFTTQSTNQKKYKEYKQNGGSSWANNEYWGGTMAENGCGITAMAIVLSGYNKNITPEDLRQEYFPVIDHDTLSSELSYVYGIENSDFYYDSIHLSNTSIEKHLKTNRPIIICVWNKPTENRWTTSSHYMVLLATDENGMVYVSNPNGLENNSKSSGWYDINEVTPYIAKALYIEEY